MPVRTKTHSSFSNTDETHTDDYTSSRSNENVFNDRLEGKRNNVSSDRTCEAVDCYEPATQEVKIPVGIFGTITFNLCYQCFVSKFGTEPCET
jgi:hypothetical protein